MASNDGDGVFAAMGCMIMLLWLGWWGFVAWMVYKGVMWLTAQEL